VAVCTGIHFTPNIPHIPGLETVPLVLHSSQLKTREQFGSNTHVVVMGAGETGMDIAHLAVTAKTASVTLCHREGFFCAPKVGLAKWFSRAWTKAYRLFRLFLFRNTVNLPPPQRGPISRLMPPLLAYLTQPIHIRFCSAVNYFGLPMTNG
jgi:cation diffusion facilitator CzcD-associated flavoprotein CzcO